MFGRAIQFLYYDAYTYGQTSHIDHDHNKPSLRRILAVKNHAFGALWDQEDDRQLSNPTIDLAMYEIAEKYGISRLKRYALKEFASGKTRIPYAQLHDLITSYFPDQVQEDEVLKKAVARRIARVYGDIRGVDDTAGKAIKKWLKEDNDLCHMVIDTLVD